MSLGPDVDTRLNVAIIGGGIGGICTAIGLLQNPYIDVHIYEAWSNFGDIGAGVAFGPNASRALQLISSEAFDIFWRLATPNLAPGKGDVFFDVIAGEGPRTGETLLSMRNETGQRTFHRARILETLGKLVPAENCHFDKRVESITMPDTSSHQTTLHFKDGTTAQADCVVGADGVHSQTRKAMFGYKWRRYEPQFTGSAGYRCLAPMDVAREAIGDDALRSLWIWGRAGPLTLYPIDGGKTLNLVGAYTSRQSWEGPWVRPAKPGETTEAFAAYSDSLSKKVLALVESLSPKVYSLWDLPPLPTWVRGNVALIGDAAHASTPFQAAGAGQAVEDALILTRLLGRVRHKSELAAALHAYEEIRRPRGTAAAQTSLEAGELNSMRLPGVMDDAQKYVQNQEQRMQWLWNVDHESEIQRALQTFEAAKLDMASATVGERCALSDSTNYSEASVL